MDEWGKLFSECKSKEEEKALYQMFRIALCLKKHKALRDIYKKSNS